VRALLRQLELDLGDRDVPADTHCVALTEDAGVCLASCDPLAPACDAGQACAWLIPEFSCLEVPSDARPLGEPCGFVNDCQPGGICLESVGHPSCAGAACCAASCDLDLPDTCAPGTVCQPFLPDGRATPDQASIGVCTVPDWVPSLDAYPHTVTHGSHE
jgi:hypothetical protein